MKLKNWTWFESAMASLFGGIAIGFVIYASFFLGVKEVGVKEIFTGSILLVGAGIAVGALAWLFRARPLQDDVWMAAAETGITVAIALMFSPAAIVAAILINNGLSSGRRGAIGLGVATLILTAAIGLKGLKLALKRFRRKPQAV